MVLEIRHLTVLVSDLAREAGRQVSPPLRKVVSAAVITNPFAGKYVEDLAELIGLGAELSKLLSDRAVAAIEGATVHSYGKAAIVGIDGELEHAAAILHPNFGQPLRDAIGGGKSLIPSAKKRGAPGTAIDIPLHHKDAAFVRTHFDAIEFRIGDAPFANEILVALAISSGGRPLPRVGGLQASQIVGEDGLR